MKIKIAIIFFLMITSSFLFHACGGTGGEGSVRINNNEMFRQLSNQVIIPIYAELKNQGENLRVAIQELCVDVNANTISSAQNQWKSTKRAMARAEVIDFGPYKDNNHVLSMNRWPINPDFIERRILNDPNENFSIAHANDSDVGVKGLTVMEYILFQSAPDTDDLSFSLSRDNMKRCRFLSVIAENFFQQGIQLHAAWNGNFAQEFSTAGQGSEVYENTKDANADLINAWVNSFVYVRDTKLGKPLGLTRRTNGISFGRSESLYSDYSIETMIYNFKGILAIYSGEYAGLDGLGFYDVVADKNIVLAEELLQDLINTIVSLESFNDPFSVLLQNRNEALNDIFSSMGVARNRLLQLANLFSVSLTYINDGD